MAIRGRSFPLKAANIGRAPVAVAGNQTGDAAPVVTVGATSSGTLQGVGGATRAVTIGVAASGTVNGGKFVTSIAASGRYFLDQNGNPLLIKGYFAWSGIADWSSTQADTYLDHVEAQGGNTILMECVAVDGDGGGPNASGATYDSVEPFVGGDVTVFNSTYWARLDSYIAKATARGLSVVLYAMDGWNTGAGKAFDGASTGDCQTYGQTLATRYLSVPGILWGFGGDYTPDGGTVDAQFNACLTGIRAAGDNRPATIQLDYYKSLSTDSSYWESRVQFNFVYTYYVQYKGVLDGYRRTPGARDPRPSMWMEGRYEGEGGGPGEPTVIPEVFRKQELWSLTSGSPGVFYGSSDWNFPSGWEGRLGTTTEDQLQSTREWFEALPWHTLVPDDVTAVVTAGRGTEITTDSATWPGSNDYVTAARSADGSLVVAYVPSNSGNTARTLTLDPTKLPTSNRVSLWVDPTNAASTQTATITSNQVTTPGTHGDGTRDWLLLITGDPLTGDAAPTITVGTTATGVKGLVTGATPTVAVTATATGTRGAASTTASTVAVAVTATGATGLSTSAAPAVTVTVTASGAVTKAGDTTPAIAVTVAADGTLAKTSTAAPTIAVSTSTDGVRATSTGATTAISVAVTADGSVSSPGSSGATPAISVAVTAAGTVQRAGVTTPTVTVAVSADGQRSTATGATTATTVSVTASGTVGKASGATPTATITVTADGSVASAGNGSASTNITISTTPMGALGVAGAGSVAVGVGVTAAGTVQRASGATRAIIVAVTASGDVTGPVVDPVNITWTTTGQPHTNPFQVRGV